MASQAGCCDGVEMIISSSVLYTLVTANDFFRRVPEFAFMKKQAEAAQKLLLSAMSPASSDCVGCARLSQVMKPVMATFIGHVRQLLEDSPEALDNLVAYIKDKRGHRPVPISLMYRDARGSVAKIEF